MEIANCIVESGVGAVLHYRNKAPNETKIPKVYLARFMAVELTRLLGRAALTEVHFTNVIADLGIQSFSEDIIHQFGGLRADVAVYQGHRPEMAVEIKIVDEGRPLSGVLLDWKKIRALRGFLSSRASISLDAYVAALICDTGAGTLSEQTVAELEQALGVGRVVSSKKIPALGGGWGWQFVCGGMRDAP